MMKPLSSKPYSLRRSGGGIAVQVPRAFAEMHGLTVRSKVRVYVDREKLIVIPCRPEERESAIVG